MTDVPGVLKDKDDIKTKYTALDIRSTRQLVADGIIAGGMIPKYVALPLHTCVFSILCVYTLTHGNAVDLI